MAIVFALSVFGAAQDTEAAMVRAAGTMSINGVSVRNSSPLRTGDILQAGPDSTAAISSKGVMILVFPNSTILYSGRNVELRAGHIKVAASSGMVAKVDSYEVTSFGRTVKFQLDRNGSCGSVSPERGTVIVRDCNKTSLVQAGTTSVLGERGCAAPENSKIAKRTSSIGSHKTGYGLAGAAAVGALYGRKKGGKISPDSPDE